MMESQNPVAQTQISDDNQSIVVDDNIPGVVDDGGGDGDGRRKRGRPSRNQGLLPPPLPPKAIPKPPAAVKKIKQEAEEEEDVCFICFDGGSLVLCDHRACPKAYHPACIKRDEEFFESAAKWNCGWHICSICQKTARHMCYTCTYSLCRGCIRKADYVCVRGDKGFCTICMKMIKLIENNGQGEDGKVQADFDDKLSWEYLFKVYWVYVKGKLSLTMNELTEAKNPWKEASTIYFTLPSTGVNNIADNLKSITSTLSVGNLEENESKRRKLDDGEINIKKETVNMENHGTDETATTVKCEEWATKELLDFVAHMKNGNTSVLSRIEVKALMKEYVNRNNLRDPKKKNQIICDSRLNSLFGKPRVGYIQMLNLLEHHFSVKDSRKRRVNRTAVQVDPDWNNDNMPTVAKDKKRRNQSKGEERAPQNKLDEFAAVDVHNIKLMYLRRPLMENLLEEGESFHGKVVGSIVRIKISGCDLKHDMYRLVQVVGTSKVDVPYKIDSKSTDFMLEVLNLDKKETISLDSVSDQEFSEDECRRLQQSIRCGLVKHFTVGEIQEKAVALQSVRLNDWMEKEILQLSHLRDVASEKGHKKGYRECVEKLQLLKAPEERERRLQEIPVVHSDPKMNPHYESDDTEEYFNKEHGDHMESKCSTLSNKNSRSPKKRAARLSDADSRTQKDEKPTNKTIATQPNIEDEAAKTTTRTDVEKDTSVSTLEKSQNEIDCNASAVTKMDQHATLSSSISDTAPKTLAKTTSSPMDVAVWHYLDPNAEVQGPFSLSQLQSWRTEYFPPDMRIWANHKDKSVLLDDVLKEQFNSYDIHCNENITPANKDGNQIDGLNICSAIPSATVAVNHAKLSDGHGSSGQSFGQNWSNNNNLNFNPVSESTVHINTSNTCTERVEVNINQHAPTPTTAVFDLPGPTPKKETVDEVEKIQSARDLDVVVDSGNHPSWSSASSLVVGGAKFPASNDWGGGGGCSSTPVKPEEWVDSGLVSISSFKPLEVAGDHVATPTSNIDANIHSAQPACNDFTTWHGMGEMIEFSTLAEESVSDLLAEVDAMESQYGLPSPTSRRNSFVDDLFNGSFDEFSPTPDQGTRSDGFSSSGDIQLNSQPNTTTTSTDEQVNAFDFMKTSNGLQQHSYISPNINGQAVGDSRKTSYESVGFKWPELERAPHGMIDINSSANAEGEEGEFEIKPSLSQAEVKVENGHNHYIIPLDNGKVGGSSTEQPTEEMKSAEAMQAVKTIGIGAKLVTRVAQIKGLEGTTNNRRTCGVLAKEEDDGEFIAPQPLPPQPPQPRPPPLSLGLDPFEPPRDVGSDSVHDKFNHAGRNTNTGQNGNIRWDPNQNQNQNQNHQRHSNSPRDSSRNTRSFLNKQSSFGSGGAGGGGSGGGYSRPPPKGQQRVCRFYESGRCRKGASCKYLHPSP